MNALAADARSLLYRLSGDEQPRREAAADDLLLFFYRLRDEYAITRSRSAVVRGPGFQSLNSLLYDLESRPSETIGNAQQLSAIQTLLADIASGAIEVAPVRRSPRG